jgi:hypothetical protein
METTYVSMTNLTNQPTTSPTPPVEYIGIRITASHDDWEKIKKVGKYEENWYMCWKEHGKSGTNPHFHVCVPGSKPADVGCTPWAAIISLNRFLGPVDDYVTTNSTLTKSQSHVLGNPGKVPKGYHPCT